MKKEYDEVCKPKCARASDRHCCYLQCLMNEVGLYADGKFADLKDYVAAYDSYYSTLKSKDEWQAIVDRR